METENGASGMVMYCAKETVHHPFVENYHVYWERLAGAWYIVRNLLPVSAQVTTHSAAGWTHGAP